MNCISDKFRGKGRHRVVWDNLLFLKARASIIHGKHWASSQENAYNFLSNIKAMERLFPYWGEKNYFLRVGRIPLNIIDFYSNFKFQSILWRESRGWRWQNCHFSGVSSEGTGVKGFVPSMLSLRGVGNFTWRSRGGSSPFYSWPGRPVSVFALPCISCQMCCLPQAQKQLIQVMIGWNFQNLDLKQIFLFLIRWLSVLVTVKEKQPQILSG